MKMIGRIILTTVLSLSMITAGAQKKWTLQDCIDYAAQNKGNTSLRNTCHTSHPGDVHPSGGEADSHALPLQECHVGHHDIAFLHQFPVARPEDDSHGKAVAFRLHQTRPRHRGGGDSDADARI